MPDERARFPSTVIAAIQISMLASLEYPAGKVAGENDEDIFHEVQALMNRTLVAVC